MKNNKLPGKPGGVELQLRAEPGSGELQLRAKPGSGELQLRAKEGIGGAGAPPPQVTKEDYSNLFTTHLGFAEEWNIGGNLPHRNSKHLIQSITFRMADSMPQNVLKDIEEELKTLPDTKREIGRRKKFDKWLDKGLGCCALGKHEMAQVVWDALQHHNGDRYNLIAWSIMPNHVHVLIETEHNLAKIIQSWKSYTGRWAMTNNEKYSLGIEPGSKQFWRSEYWDRFIRDEAHFNHVVRYILDNPGKAKLSKDSVAYKFTGSVLPGGE